jgi:ABC-type multidrug transport system ATPase subunit
MEKEGSSCDGIRVIGLNKIFRIGLFRPRIVHALKDIYLEISNGELLALLGHNGAGKSTLINILTGILGWNSGTARVNGMTLEGNLSEIQHLIGLVPQFDILWGELTAAEHLKLFAQLKGIPNEEIEELIRQKLAEVNLEKQENSLVRTFSGGMKRRLSIAIGTIGNPQIIIMDEPTTGMDPVNKHSVWHIIKVLVNISIEFKTQEDLYPYHTSNGRS